MKDSNPSPLKLAAIQDTVSEHTTILQEHSIILANIQRTLDIHSGALEQLLTTTKRN